MNLPANPAEWLASLAQSLRLVNAAATLASHHLTTTRHNMRTARDLTRYPQ